MNKDKILDEFAYYDTIAEQERLRYSLMDEIDIAANKYYKSLEEDYYNCVTSEEVNYKREENNFYLHPERELNYEL